MAIQGTKYEPKTKKKYCSHTPKISTVEKKSLCLNGSSSLSIQIRRGKEKIT